MGGILDLFRNKKDLKKNQDNRPSPEPAPVSSTGESSPHTTPPPGPSTGSTPPEPQTGQGGPPESKAPVGSVESQEAAEGPSPVETSSDEPPDSSAPGTKDIEEKAVEVLRNTFDPEIPVNIYELGLIYEVKVDGSNAVYIKMTLTSPACPVAGTLPPEVENKVKAIPGVTGAKIDLVWDPPWDPSMMTEAAKLQLGMM